MQCAVCPYRTPLLQEKPVNRFPLASIALALASSLSWVPPAAAIDLTNYVPFQAEVTCSGNLCKNSLSLPVNRTTVLEYISFECSNIPFGGKLAFVQVGTTINGTVAFHNLEIPVTASLGDAPNGVAASGQVVRIYAEPGSKIDVEAAIANAGGFIPLLCTIAFSGEQSPVLPP
jgi:hypothetical protein